MRPELERIIANIKRYNAGEMCAEVFGFDKNVAYDALVAAPGWKPTKIIKDPAYKVTPLATHSYVSGYLVERDGVKIAWAQTSSGAGSLFDNLVICAEMKFKKLIFAGAAGGLSPDFKIGDFCTPAECISGVYIDHYLGERLDKEYRPFSRVYPDPAFVDRVSRLSAGCGCPLRQAKVFSTESIALEYSHLPGIKATGAQLIEMETSTFYRLAAMIEVPAIALLIVSDNSATGDPLLGRGEERDKSYGRARSVIIPEMICNIAAL